MNLTEGRRAHRAVDLVVTEELVQRLVATGLCPGRCVVGREQVVDRLDHLAVADAEALVRRLETELVPTVRVAALVVEGEAGEVRAKLGAGAADHERRGPRRGGRRKMRRALVP